MTKKQEIEEYVFISAEPFSGVSKQDGKPYTLHKIKFADPITFENHSLDYKEGMDTSKVSKGDKITLEKILQPPFNRFGDSRYLVVAVHPVEVKVF